VVENLTLGTLSVRRLRPKSVIGQLLSHSRKQTFAVQPHRQDCAHDRRLAKRRCSSKADAALMDAQGCFGWRADVFAPFGRANWSANRYRQSSMT
jgi:hypothetical protein